MLLNLTRKIEKLCTHSENIVIYNQFGLYNMLDCVLKEDRNKESVYA